MRPFKRVQVDQSEVHLCKARQKRRELNPKAKCTWPDFASEV